MKKKKISKYKSLFLGIGFVLPLSTFVIASCASNSIQNNIAVGDNQPTIISLDPKDGFLDNGNLKVSKYVSLIKHLNLTKNTKLTSLTDQIMNKKIHNVLDYQKLNLKIKSGYTQEGNLNLLLNGQYKNEIIEEQEINITGFLKIDKNTSLSFQNIQFNLDNWFNDFKPIANSNINNNEIISIIKEDWLNKYLKSFNVIFNNNSLNKQTFFDYDFSFNTFKATINTNSHIIKFSIDIAYQNKTFSNGNWINSENTIINVSHFNSPEIALPSVNQLYQWLMDSIILDETEIGNYYPSYWMSLPSLYEKSFSSYNWPIDKIKNKELVEKIKNKYINTEVNFVIHSVDDANDFLGKLSFTFILQIGDNKFTNIQRKLDKFTVKPRTFDKLGFINNANKENQVLIKHSSSLNDLIWFNQIKKYLKSNNSIDVNEVINMQVNEYKEIMLPNNHFIAYPIIYNKPLIHFSDEDNSANSSFEIIKKNIDPKIFNSILTLTTGTPGLPPSINKNTINKDSHLFNYSDNKNDAFYIEDIRYSFDEKQIPIKLTKSSNGFYIDISGFTNISFASGVWKKYPTKFTTLITNTEWNQ